MHTPPTYRSMYIDHVPIHLPPARLGPSSHLSESGCAPTCDTPLIVSYLYQKLGPLCHSSVFNHNTHIPASPSANQFLLCPLNF